MDAFLRGTDDRVQYGRYGCHWRSAACPLAPEAPPPPTPRIDPAFHRAWRVLTVRSSFGQIIAEYLRARTVTVVVNHHLPYPIIQVNHLHPDNALHLETFDYYVPSDLPAAVIEAGRAESDRLVAESLGRDQVDPDTLTAFEVINGSMIHDIGNLHGMFGSPRRVVSTDIWAGGVALTTVLEYAGDARAVCTWVALPELLSFEETLEVYGSRDRVIASFPTGWSRGLPTDVTVQQIDAEGLAVSTTRSWQANPFKLELEHFAACIARGEQPLTPGREAIEHVALVRDIVLAHRCSQYR